MTTYRRILCPKCGERVAANWLIRHLKIEHLSLLPVDAGELDRECRALVEQALVDAARLANRMYWREAISAARRRGGGVMKVRVKRTEYIVRVQIDPFDDAGFRDLITIERHRRLGGRDEWEAAEIRWHCLGIQDQEHTMAFAHALHRAAGYAERLDLNHDAEIMEQG